MKDEIYGILLGATDLDDARYRSQSRRSGLNLPRTLDDFYRIAQCTDRDLDFRTFMPSVAETLAHWLGHHQDILGAVAFPSENYFENLDVKSAKSRLKDPLEIAEMMLQVRIYQQRINEKVIDNRLTGDPKPLVGVFNEAMKYYMESVLPMTRELFKISADYLEERKPDIVEEVKKRMKAFTQTT